MTDYSGKSAVVLGASDPTSIGGAVAQRLIAAGARVMVAARRADRVSALADELGCEWAICDITHEHQVETLATHAVQKFGGLDVAINCAGDAVMGDIAVTSDADLRRAVDVHFIGTFYFIRQMASAIERNGAIATMSSITATLTLRNHAAYMGAKAGADHLVRIAALEYGEYGIKVNSVSPGFTDDTPMSRPFLRAPGLRETFEKEIPLGRLNTADDVAAAVAWICSDESFLTGQNLQVNGGNTLNRLPTLEELGAG